ncbi:hypothetical protein DEJ23_04740 [Curtobacterium sp. MCSS17_008]|uniref:hypothetical protein n=1 Tax=Curtobacterium sp. MCSS17_008 TaxID=2175647 RepID=UPI000DA72289|nr:hypothetical protein [Curtobacterium sp. MCSS17_008]PZF58204.1 hypothetical protein DEJ23_04740 [Curtobacterium sp. MCSS17_008]
MTSTNRTLNRILLLALGLVAITVGVVIGAGVLTPVRDAVQQYVTLPGRVTVPDTAMWVIATVCAVVVVLALVVVCTRGGGGTSVAVRERTGTDQVTVNVALVRDVIEHELRGVRDVVSTKVDTYLVKKDRAARIRVHVRRGGDAVTVLDAVDHAVTTLDRTLGRPVPVLVHLAGGTRNAPARTTRVQ